MFCRRQFLEGGYDFKGGRIEVASYLFGYLLMADLSKDDTSKTLVQLQ